ncbi:glycosyltransferase family 1 protein [Williamsia sp. CHRR-6]|nr:glycosyltransferase family 1 protein [Williamsia sp. CHRR-6]
MDLLLAFSGSRGDVQPGLVLGTALTRRGHRVRIAVPPNLVEFARRSGLPVHPCGVDTSTLLSSDVAVSQVKSSNPRTRLAAVAAIASAGAMTALRELMDLSHGADAIVGGSVGQERMLTVAEARGIPYLPVHLCPMRPNRSVTLLSGMGVATPRPLYRPSWSVIERVLWWNSRAAENALREHLGLSAARSPTGHRIDAQRVADRPVPTIGAYDPALFPGLDTEWGRRRPLTGFLTPDATLRARLGDAGDDTALEDWLSDGDAPLYVGFGSMTLPDPDAMATAVLRTAAALGVRLLVAAGWSGFLSDVSDDDTVIVRPTVDHARVLPRCLAAIHHGGAGSTAATVRAGLPTFAYWMGADQPIWAQALRSAGIGSGAPAASADPTRLTAQIRTLVDAATRDRAASVARSMVDEAQAAARAVAVIEATMTGAQGN